MERGRRWSQQHCRAGNNTHLERHAQFLRIIVLVVTHAHLQFKPTTMIMNWYPVCLFGAHTDESWCTPLHSVEAHYLASAHELLRLGLTVLCLAGYLCRRLILTAGAPGFLYIGFGLSYHEISKHCKSILR
ncbi:uncharacterized protein LOC119286063 [Triticum dicoccoides]|uniref:uncharacterized protein LOC119286063 n=1 Tax=Triticum dicoccoides TaxID=85692 RepID=UPI00188E25F8|nr:uncharacterized protein LOC119286063 [Triticum dicoccoides]